MTDILVQDAQILNAREYEAMRAALSLNHRLLFDGCIFTGMRMSEFWSFIQHLEWYHSERSFIAITSKKTETRYKDRNVILSNMGNRAIQDLVHGVRFNGIKPITRMGWQEDLKRAARKAGLENLHGIMPKMTRKTWVSWLVTTYPDDGLRIAASLGHDPRTMVEHYLSLPFSAEERAQILPLVIGWGGRTNPPGRG